MPAIYIEEEDPKIVEDWNGLSTENKPTLANDPELKSVVPQDNLPPPPDRNRFESQDEYEEAIAYYNSRVGRIRKLVERARATKASKDK